MFLKLRETVAAFKSEVKGPKFQEPMVMCQSCEHVPGTEQSHVCPYVEELFYDQTPCNCCDDCTLQCRKEI